MAESGFLVAEIRAVKQMGTEHVLFVDQALNDWLGHSVRFASSISVCRRDGDMQAAEHLLSSAGHYAKSGDIFTQEEVASSRAAMRGLV